MKLIRSLIWVEGGVGVGVCEGVWEEDVKVEGTGGGGGVPI